MLGNGSATRRASGDWQERWCKITSGLFDTNVADLLPPDLLHERRGLTRLDMSEADFTPHRP
jgi:hypothetical protein